MAGPRLAEWQGTCSALSLDYELRTSSWRPVTRNPTSLLQYPTRPSWEFVPQVLAPRVPRCRGLGPAARPRGQEAADGPAPH